MARQNLQRNAEPRNKDSKFFSPQPGEKSNWIFDAEKIQPVEKEFDGRKVQRFQYIIQDPNNPEYEKYWTVSKRTSEQIDAYLSEGHSLLKIKNWFRKGNSLQYYACCLRRNIVTAFLTSVPTNYIF